MPKNSEILDLFRFVLLR